MANDLNCPSCQHPLPEEALFCSSCGTATAKILKTTIRNSPETDAGLRSPKVGHDPDPRVGLVLDSKYQLIERLGQGGMGAVYRAKRLHIGDEVAVKLLSHDLVREQQAVERFRREARSAASIRHPNVVSIHDFNDQSGSANEAYIVMELVKGESLRSLLEREVRFTPERAVGLMLDICAGVGVAHRQDLLHRDLKPDNVIVSPPTHEGEQETAKVVDFGLAKVRDEVSPLTQTGTLMGTLYYMSPEQCRGEELDARTDVYSLGAMLYEMLSGGPPFRANNATGLITKHLHDTPPPFDQSLGIPSRIVSVCLRALAKDREQRQRDALVFSKELQAALSTQNQTADQVSQVTVARQVSTTPATRQGSSLKWAIIVVPGLLMAAVLVASLVWGAFIWSKKTNSTTANTSSRTEQQQPTATPQEIAKTNTSVTDLRGTWTGTYGPLNSAATLVIKNHNGQTFDGVLQQGSIRVAFEGTLKSDTLQMRQTKVLAGEGWDLGEDTGTVSSDGKSMSGTGKDAMGSSLGLTYPWTFSRQ